MVWVVAALVLALAPFGPAAAQKSAPQFNALAAIVFPNDDGAPSQWGVYLGHGLVLTNWHPWTLDGQFYTEETSPLSPSRQVPAYDDDGHADPEEVMASQADCAGMWTALDQAGAACAPFVRVAGAGFVFPLVGDHASQVVPIQRLLFASRAHDIALFAVDESAVAALGVQAAHLRTTALEPGQTLLAAYAPPGEPATLLPVALGSAAAALLPDEDAIRLDGPWQVPSVTVTSALPEGAPVLDRASGDVLGLAWRVAGSKTAPETWVTPTAEWIDALFAAADSIQDPALAGVLAEAHLAPVDAPLTLGDSLAPSLGNSGIDVQHYALDLAFDLKGRKLSGTAALTIRATSDQLLSFGLDAAQLGVEQVTLDGSPVSFVPKNQKLVIELPAPVAYGTQFEVVVTYTAQPEPFTSRFIPFYGIGLMFDGDRVSALNEPDAAHTWFPCNDHPRDRATYDFRLTVPTPLEAVANGMLLETRDNPAGTRTFHWRMDAPMSTYLATVALGEYEVISGRTADGIALAHYVPPDAVDAGAKVFGTTGQALELLESLFGPYPFASYGHVVVPRGGLALETQTMTVMPDSILSASETEAYTLVVHELAHQWYGNAVTPGSWSDIWLNEGFASYAEWLAREARFGADTAIAGRSFSERSLISDSRATPLVAPAPAELFGIASYDKGAWVLHMLRREIGDEAFFTLLRTYVEAFRDRPTDTLAFWRLAEQVSGQDLAWFFEQWLLQGGMPRYNLYWAETGAGADVLLCADDTGSYRLDLPLVFQRVSGTAAATLAVDGTSAHASYDLPFAPAALIPDPAQTVLAQVQVQPIAALPEVCPLPGAP